MGEMWLSVPIPEMELERIKVAVVFWRLGPYHHARLKAAAQRMQVFGIESCGMEDTNYWDRIDGAASFPKTTLTQRHFKNRAWIRELQRKMFATLDELRPDVVAIPGWSLVDALVALLWCSLNHTPAVLMSDSTAIDSRRTSWKEEIKRRIVNLCSSALVAGTPHVAYVIQLGMCADRVFVGYDVVDNDYFANGASRVKLSRLETSVTLGLPRCYFIASARFIEEKNLLRLLQAFAYYRRLVGDSKEMKTEPPPCSPAGASLVAKDLVLVGDGPLRDSVLTLRSKLGLESCVHLPGFKQYRDLPTYYGLASAFIHMSLKETWGLVVNEAMASGLPVLISNRCGCVTDLVREGVNGFSFDPFDVEQPAELMYRLSNINFPLAQFGAESQRVIADWGPGRFVTGLESAVVAALKSGAQCSRLTDRILLRALISCGNSD